MTAARADQDCVSFARPASLPGVELVSVAYRDRSFPTHIHEEYVVGTVIAGAEHLDVGGVRHVVGTGDVLRLHPGEPHANRSLGDETLRYRVFYLPAASVMPYLDADRGERCLSFASPVARDDALSLVLAETHEALSSDLAGQLEQESTMMALVRALARSMPDTVPESDSGGAGIRRARDYIEVHFAEGFGLAELSAVADLSAFHLVRSFKKATGLSPLAYRNQQRVNEARRLLLAGGRIAEVALDVGFADQSHLTRQFQRVMGVSPGRYAQQ
jgi:AraC-like DNA-binding protein